MESDSDCWKRRRSCVYCFVYKGRGFGRWSFLDLMLPSDFLYWIFNAGRKYLLLFNIVELLNSRTGGQDKH